MSWLNTSSRTVTPPPCFGKSWERDSPECVGGPDSAYDDGKGGHIRESCGFYSACGSRTQAVKMEEAQKNLIPATSLAKAWQGRSTTPNPQPLGGTSFGIQQFTAQQQLEAAQKQMQQMQAQMAAWQRGQFQPQSPMMQMAPVMPHHGYQQMMPVNFEIPQYLTKREYRKPDEGIFRVLGREVARSMMKSAGHTFANFFDSTPFFEPPKKE